MIPSPSGKHFVRGSGRKPIILRSGRIIDCSLDPQSTTAAARLEPGMSFRIALQMATDVPKTVKAVEIHLGTEILMIVP